MITFEETGTIQPNYEDLEELSVFRSTSGSDLNISHLEKYIDRKYSETFKPSQTVLRLFNEENNKQYGSFSQNKPILREFITPSDVILTLCNQHPWKRDLAIQQIPASLAFCRNKWNLCGQRQDFKNLLYSILSN